jgi:hypothetical protein
MKETKWHGSNATKKVGVNDDTTIQFTTQIGGNKTHKINDNMSKR